MGKVKEYFMGQTMDDMKPIQSKHIEVKYIPSTHNIKVC